jgi:hypothetical protein
MGLSWKDSTGVEVVAGPHAAWPRTPVALDAEDSATSARFTVSAGDRVQFVLTHTASHAPRPTARHLAGRTVGSTAHG